MTAAIKHISAARESRDIQLKTPDPLNDLVERVGKTQEFAGDAAGAKISRAQIVEPPSPKLKEWLEFMRSYNPNGVWTDDVGKHINEITQGSPLDAANKLGLLAQALAADLRRVALMEKKTGL
jgi:hypothetical protein